MVSAHRVTPAADDVDFFPTPPWAARAGAEIIARLDPACRTVWEPACGAGSMAHGLRDVFETVHASDACLYDRTVIHDFLSPTPPPFGPVDWIVTNPPFAPAEAFVAQAWTHARRGVAMLMRGAVLEGRRRHALMHGPRPLTVFAPFSERVPMVKGRYDPDQPSAAFYAWFLWLKPVLRPARFMARAPLADGTVGLRPAVLDIPPGTRERLFRRSDLAFAVDGAAKAKKAGGHD